MSIHIIASLARDRVIGANGDQPWYIPEDLALFRQLTEGQTVIMGLTTFHTPRLRRPLPNRHNIVLSDQAQDIPGVTVCRSLLAALTKARSFGTEIFAIGGASIYEQFLPLADHLHLSWVKQNYPGTVYFPDFSPADWVQVSEKDFAQFTYVAYKKKNA